jgi:hypothetical protein
MVRAPPEAEEGFAAGFDSGRKLRRLWKTRLSEEQHKILEGLAFRFINGKFRFPFRKLILSRKLIDHYMAIFKVQKSCAGS